MSVNSAHIVEELGHLMQLRVLWVLFRKDEDGRWDESMGKVLVGSLGKLHKLQTLVVLVITNGREIDLAPCLDCKFFHSLFITSNL